MDDTVSHSPTDRETAAREMLAALRLLSIKGHVPDSQERVERWESALSVGEPGLSRLAAIRGVLEFFDWECGDRQSALEEIDQIATGSRTESGTEPGGSAYLTAPDVSAVLDALDLAADCKRGRAEECSDCDVDPQSALCPACEGRLARAGDFDALAAKLGAS